MPRRSSLLIVIGLLAMIVLAGCSDEAKGGATAVREVAAAEAVDELESRTVIDVRTPTEFGAGHVGGAVNIDVEAPDFEERITGLDPEAPYLVYCRSGRRSAIAAATMAEAGFTDIVDAGGLEQLAAAGAPIE